MNYFNQTGTILDTILSHKIEEIEADKVRLPLNVARKKAELSTDEDRAPRDFIAALSRDTVALVAEVKKASPSKGILVEDFDPIYIGRTYSENGAAAVSVLTDQHFFQGHLDYMGVVRKAVTVPVLRKDFIIDPYQVYVSRAFCADACLLIAAALDDAQLRALSALIRELGMVALIEVHTEWELERALSAGAQLVGINNRDLKSFHVDLSITERLARLVPSDVVLIAESGILSAVDVYRMGTYGAHAVLVGESLVKSPDLAQSVRSYSSQKREPRQW